VRSSSLLALLLRIPSFRSARGFGRCQSPRFAICSPSLTAVHPLTFSSAAHLPSSLFRPSFPPSLTPFYPQQRCPSCFDIVYSGNTSIRLDNLAKQRIETETEGTDPSYYPRQFSPEHIYSSQSPKWLRL
jgi:hypothetical protein